VLRKLRRFLRQLKVKKIANCGAERVADTAVGAAEGGSTCLVTRDSVRIWHDAPRTGCIRATIHTETENRRSVMKISRLNFSHLPTPVEALPRLSEALGGPRLLIKRDDQALSAIESGLDEVLADDMTRQVKAELSNEKSIYLDFGPERTVQAAA
jgi:hypothetical protein